MKHRMYIESAQVRICRDTEPGFILAGETRDGYKLTWVLEGQLHSVADGRDALLSPGELVIYAPGQWHMQYADMEEAPHFLSIAMGKCTIDLSCLTGRTLCPDSNVTGMLSQLTEELQAPDPYSKSMILSALEMALMHLLRAQDRNAPQITPAVHGENLIIRRAQQYVSTHVHEKLSVPIVAEKSDVSPSYLTALFQKHLHISPGEYIRRVKLQKSKELIREGKLNFTEIAEALNYSTVHHFSRQFKEKFGISPTEYAKSIR